MLMHVYPCITRKSILKVFIQWDNILRDKLYHGPVAFQFLVFFRSSKFLVNKFFLENYINE